MSYALTIPLRGLGISASASVTTKNVADAAGVELPDCSSAAVTGNDYIDSTFVGCCNEIKKKSGLSNADKAKGIGQCVARGAATGACMAAGVVTFGVSTALAPLCGTVGAALFNRAMGWDTGQWVAATAAGAACGAMSGGVLGPVCAFVAAELVGWISDALGPVIDGIFNPSAAKDRELAARKAFHALENALESQLLESDQAIGDLWSNSIRSIKEAYLATTRLLPGVYPTKAELILGFSPKYNGIAKALAAAGASTTSLQWRIGPNGDTVGNRMQWRRANGDGHGCEMSAEGCANDGYSEICPISFRDMYLDMYFAQGMDKLTGNTRDRQMAFDKKALEILRAKASAVLPEMQQAIAVVMTKVVTVALLLKQQALLDEAKAKDEAKWVATIVAAAKSAEIAADEAKSWNSAKRNSAVLRAQNKYESASKARAVLSGLITGSSVSAANRTKVYDAVARASAAAKAARANAQTAQLMIGATATVGVVGIGYLLLKRT